jgi:FtsP/CotA-like multicopper oxidase with cupredoxin domain
MKIKVFGVPVIPKDLPTTLIPYDNFENAQIDNTRVLTFSEGGTADNPTFLLDGKEFNPKVIDQIMELGTIEEWRIVNESGEIHPFHIHINPFQVVSINGEKIDRKSYDDTFPIPAKSEVVMRTKYKDYDGKYVLHCHILFHEDHGMMQVVEVVLPGNDTTPHNGMPEREEMPITDHDDMKMDKARPRLNVTPVLD